MMLRLKLCSVSAHPNHCFTGGLAPLFSFFSSHARAPPPVSTKIQNPFLYHYLIDSFGFPEPLARSISHRFTRIKTPERPQSVVQLFKHLGFSDTQIETSVRLSPQILFADVEKNLKPKLHFFHHQLGISGSNLGKFISKNPNLLTRSLTKSLKPRVETLKKVFENEDVKNQDLILILQHFYLSPESRFLSNLSYLKSCGIVGSQLLILLKRQPALFGKHESELRQIVSCVLDMGFSTHSRTFAHAIRVVGSLSNETIMRKLGFFQSFGFSEDETMQMFRRLPVVISASEEKLKLGIEFYRNVLKFDNKVLVDRPAYFTYSMEDRVIPRYKVLQFMKSRGLFKKEPSLFYLLTLTERQFLKFMLKFVDDADELSVLYKGHLLELPGK